MDFLSFSTPSFVDTLNLLLLEMDERRAEGGGTSGLTRTRLIFFKIFQDLQEEMSPDFSGFKVI